MSDFGIRNTPSFTPVNRSTPPVSTPPETEPTQNPETTPAAETAPTNPAPPATTPTPSPDSEAQQDASEGIASYENNAAKSAFALKPSFALSTKFALLEDLGKYKDISKLSISGDFTLDATLAKVGKSKLGISGNLSPGLSMKNYNYKGEAKTGFTADLGLDVKPYLKTKLAGNYLKVGPTLNATGRYDLNKNKPGFDMSAGVQATYQINDWGVGAFYSQGISKDIQGQGMGGLKLSYNIFGK